MSVDIVVGFWSRKPFRERLARACAFAFVVLVFSLLTVVFVQLCETPNSNRFELFPEAKNTSQKHLIEAFTKKKKKKKKKPRIHASQQQPIFFLCAVVFLFPSFVEVRILDLSFAICVYTRAYVEFCVLGGFPFRNRN